MSFNNFVIIFLKLFIIQKNTDQPTGVMHKAFFAAEIYTKVWPPKFQTWERS
jgi:hypothetical protein